MESINQYGRTPHEIAEIICEMNPEIKLKGESYPGDDPDMAELKHRKEMLENQIEDLRIMNDDYDIKTPFFTKPSQPAHPNSSRRNTTEWARTNGLHFASLR